MSTEEFEEIFAFAVVQECGDLLFCVGIDQASSDELLQETEVFPWISARRWPIGHGCVPFSLRVQSFWSRSILFSPFELLGSRRGWFRLSPPGWKGGGFGFRGRAAGGDPVLGAVVG